jgi:hypothetical protein
MVSVGMGKEGCIETINPLPEALEPEVWGRIDDKVQVWCLDEEGGAGTIVTGIRGAADMAVTANDRDSL